LARIYRNTTNIYWNWREPTETQPISAGIGENLQKYNQYLLELARTYRNTTNICWNWRESTETQPISTGIGENLQKYNQYLLELAKSYRNTIEFYTIIIKTLRMKSKTNRLLSFNPVKLLQFDSKAS
jgi:hypothetical protein